MGGMSVWGAMVRPGALTCGPAGSQYGASALCMAASGGHTDAVELLQDRGADLEAKDEVRSACVCCCATGRAGCHRRAGGQEGGLAVTRRGVVVVWRAGV